MVPKEKSRQKELNSTYLEDASDITGDVLQQATVGHGIPLPFAI